MPEPSANPKGLCLVLHDVAPSTWKYYADFAAAVDRLGKIPLTLLVVPDFHRQGSVDRFPGFVAEIDKRLAREDEVVLHGYYHDDPGPCGTSPKDWLTRRVYTHEGEFYRLGEPNALSRLQEGVALFGRLGWPLRGFVPPAWLLGADSRRAVQGLGLAYTSDIRGLIRLPDFRLEPAPTLVWSARSGWRRALSRQWNDGLLCRQRSAPLLRLGVHPVDLRHGPVYRYWLQTLQRLLESRSPCTKSTWLERAA